MSITGITAQPRKHEMTVPRGVQGVGAARKRVRDLLASWGVDRTVCGDMAVVVSELVTNAVVHGVPEVRLVVRGDRDGLWIEVHDRSYLLPRKRVADEDSQGGRGLLVVEGLAAELGWDRTSTGKVVWARF